MTARTVLLITASLALCSTNLLAGGSIAYEDVRELIPAGARKHLEASFKISEVGDATRLGKHFGELGGERIGPYYFEATSNSVPGLKCSIGIITAAAIVDKNGKEVEEPGDAVEIKESFDFYEVRFSDEAPAGNGRGDRNSDLDERKRGPEQRPMPNPEPLSNAEKEDVVKAVRAVYSDVENAELEFDGGQMKSDDEMSGDIIRGYSRDGSIRKVEFNVAMGDHGGFKVEVSADRSGVPSFVLWEESSWSFDPKNSNKTIDTVTERRFYFSPGGQLAKALQKSFSGSGEAQLEKNRDAAKNSDFEARPTGIPGFFAALSGIMKCEDADLKDLASELWAAQDQMMGH